MKRPVVMILLAGALTLSMIAPSALPAAGNVSVVHAAVKTSNDAAVKASNDVTAKVSNTAPAETSNDEDAGEWKDKTETVYVDANADGSVKKITVKDWLRWNGDGEIIDFSKAGEKKEKNATVYSYQLGTVGKINLMVLPGGGILENVLIMQIAFVVLIAVLLLVCALEITAYYHRILEPLEKFGQKLEELEKEQSLNDDGSNNLLELESVSGKFKELLRKIQGLKIAIYEKELAEQKAELEYTQEQIKPHFFLNCLSLIHGIADKNHEGEIVEITTVLSDYMRYIFQDSKKQRDVEEELEHIEAYIRIQKLRYGEEAFSFEATMDGDIGEWKVPSLLLQTLVENSVVHGVSLDRKSEISLYLTNETYEDGEYLYICISDTGNGFSKEALDAIENDTPIIYHGRHHVGISNIKRRLALMYGERASITCSNMDENYGAVVEVRLPKTE